MVEGINSLPNRNSSSNKFLIMIIKRNYLLSFLTPGAIIGILFSWSCKKEDPFEEPAFVTTSVVAEIGSVSAKGGGNISDDVGITVTARGIVWSSSGNPTLADNEGFTEDGAGAGEFTSDITGLTTETTYYVRAYAINNLGTDYGEQVSFATIFISGEPYADPRDGNLYNTVQIGDQCWMRENLRYLPEVSPSSAGSETDPHYYVYDYQSTDVSGAIATENYQKYGVLYNWPAAMNGESSSNTNPSGVQGACPAGWHLPSDGEWTDLVDYVVSQGYPNERGDPNGAGNALKSCRQVNSSIGGECTTSEHPRWDPDDTHYGTDQFGFSALPGGARYDIGTFSRIGDRGLGWTSTQRSSSRALYRGVGGNFGDMYLYRHNKEFGFPVRCVRD
jgi:uncharacterized protein (TIGR02145 family)